MNLNQNLYDMIYKRKSFHLFRNLGEERILLSELQEIQYDVELYVDDGGDTEKTLVSIYKLL